MNTDTAVRLPIVKVVTENDRVRSFYFDYALESQPGQFLQVGIPGYEEKPFGAVVIDSEHFLISVGAVGDATMCLHTMRAGDSLTFRGPFGNFFTLPDAPKRIALVAGGYGMAPLGFLARVAIEQGHSVDIIAGAKNKDQFLIYPWFSHDRVTLHKTTDDGSEGMKGLVTEGFAAYLASTKPDAVYTVGPEGMEEKVADVCEEQGIPLQLSLERLAYTDNGPIIDGNSFKELRNTA